ncbi:MAG: hypothetical protein RDU20_04655 [Desulfomonilaceae bacterium]|nr:hypothetical protein [Desulfomonilaceae bacterium]
MVKRVICLFLSILMVSAAALAMAGGPQYAPGGCPPGSVPPGPGGGNPCAYWGDAPFPGLCGGVVALPFLVVGSLLGGNTVGPYGPVPPPGYQYAPPPGPPQGYPGPMSPPYGPAYGGYSALPINNGILGGLPGFDICSSLFGTLANGTGLGFGL